MRIDAKFCLSPSFRAFYRAVCASKERGIEFLFVYEEWVKWWEEQLGSDWLSKRGRGKDKYVMARLGDVGPYTLGNVECITGSQNGKDKAKNGRSRGGFTKKACKLTIPQVINIYLSDGTLRKLGKEYGVGLGHVGRIKKREQWAHITEDLGPPGSRFRARLRQESVSCHG